MIESLSASVAPIVRMMMAVQNMNWIVRCNSFIWLVFLGWVYADEYAFMFAVLFDCSQVYAMAVIFDDAA